MAHTPGPWTVDPALFVVSSRGEVAYGSSLRTDAESMANLLLAATAPELLEALEELWAWCRPGTAAENGAQCDTLGDVETMVESAIAKATGGGPQ